MFVTAAAAERFWAASFRRVQAWRSPQATRSEKRDLEEASNRSWQLPRRPVPSLSVASACEVGADEATHSSTDEGQNCAESARTKNEQQC